MNLEEFLRRESLILPVAAFWRTGAVLTINIATLENCGCAIKRFSGGSTSWADSQTALQTSQKIIEEFHKLFISVAEERRKCLTSGYRRSVPA